MICHSDPDRSEGEESLDVQSERSLRGAQGRLFAALRMTKFASLRMRPVVGLFLLAACASPEAGRPLGGGPGADVKNWGHPVQLHAGAQPYHNTPCVTEAVECHGPPPVFGPTPPPD
jgi:hypothetical protein